MTSGIPLIRSAAESLLLCGLRERLDGRSRGIVQLAEEGVRALEQLTRLADELARTHPGA